MFENAHWTVIFIYWLAWFIGLGLFQRRYMSHVLQQSADVQQFAFGRVGQALEFLAGVGVLLVASVLLVGLIGWPRFRETMMLAIFANLAFGYITTLSRTGARQQWAREDRLRQARGSEPEAGA